ncbi:hypothetical protein DPMN_005347 [Dreissena polymorpha]|uniref:Uncharacterized protein n=1 Tax=Dreissena polymorpha TaxID=45954 RepID=A0A9D4MS05_DREPO|nr:hypothetical protein DPMN_005347 [Dreissena polymorpha]
MNPSWFLCFESRLRDMRQKYDVCIPLCLHTKYMYLVITFYFPNTFDINNACNTKSTS